MSYATSDPEGHRQAEADWHHDVTAENRMADKGLVADADALIAGMEKCADAWWGGIGEAGYDEWKAIRDIAYRIRARAQITQPEEVSTEKVRVVDSTDVPNLLCPDETPCTSPKECASQWRCGKRIPQNGESK